MSGRPANNSGFDIARAAPMMLSSGHMGWLGIQYRDHGENWVELQLPWREDLVGQPDSGILASGPIVSLMDISTASAIWHRNRRFISMVTVDLRVDYMRPARKGATVVGHGECYTQTKSIAFVRGFAHDGDPDDPVAHVAGEFMFVDKPGS
ncbi:PaaI family thioesterase [Alteriqipengyuania sp. WL0013]|nr:PaaI family thioesterase [Alteriqipengyuania sp. WL0013]MEB3414517.1 PaaI family thioesterase [Alteriqipengyuania sp. WL0013]